MSAARDPLRQALARHLRRTGAIVLVVATGIVVANWMFARSHAHDQADRTARQVAHAVVGPLARNDFHTSAGIDRDRVGEQVEPFFTAGAVYRLKIWALDGDRATVVYSDEPRAEGVTRAVSARLADRLNREGTVVLPVPDDPEHQYEQDHADRLLEVYVGFEDAAGVPMRLEVYVPVDITGTMWSLLRHNLAISLGGLCVLAVLTLPLSLGLARRVRSVEAERRELLTHALRASEQERERLTEILHDGVVQDLSSLGLALQAAPGAGPGASGAAPATLADTGVAIGREVAKLRAALTDVYPREVTGATLVAELQALCAEFDSPRCRIAFAGTRPVHQPVTEAPAADAAHPSPAPPFPGPRFPGPPFPVPSGPVPSGPVPSERSAAPFPVPLSDEDCALVQRVVRELLRNVVKHAGARTASVTVESGDGPVVITVHDDGHGFPGDRPAAEDGHLGLRLARDAVRGAGGDLVVESEPGTGTTVRIRLAARPDPDEPRSAGRRRPLVRGRTP